MTPSLSSSMDAAEVGRTLAARAAVVESYLATCLDDSPMPERLREAMKYSLLAGGKRLRPVLCLSAAGLCGLSADRVLPFAAALECIHTYSLIHDDLPAMDDDDLRRGRPSCHKAFDEATAILAGDALLTDAFAFMASTGTRSEAADGIPPSRVLAAVAEAARAAGSGGMVGGQIIDMECTGQSDVPAETLRRLHALKTGAMFRAACATGGLLAGAGDAAVAGLRAYGEGLGAAFQIVDDILDATADTVTLGKPAGSDAGMGKTTYPGLFGLARSRELAAEAAGRAVDGLAAFAGPLAPPAAATAEGRNEAIFLRSLALYLLERIK